jgi:asparagine synthase (glutamine-hydrolysing)
VCGIVGLVGADASQARVADVRRAVKALSHRGPDDQGVAVVRDGDAPVAVFGNVRLSILDLTPAGHMPMAAADGRVWMTYNGEVYNFAELRAELEGAGHRFTSTGDTEVVLHAYLEWGPQFLRRLNGMFALAIADARVPGRPRCLLARDQLGVKPCYHVTTGDGLAFASEIKGLTALGLVPAEPDWQAIWDYFSYLYVPGPATAYAGVRQLPPASYLVWEPGRGSRVERYWSPVTAGTGRSTGGDEREAATELRALLTDAVRRQLVSDVPLGVFLSGGIDSTVLTALAAAASPGRVRTFTVVFPGFESGPVDDAPFARRVRDRYATDHAELVVDAPDPEAMLDLVSAFDQPFANPTFYLSYLISSQTRRHVKVALSGAGGDELFAGYPRYRALRWAGLLSGLPAAAGAAATAVLERALPERETTALPRRLKLLARGVGHALPEQYLRWTYYFAEEDKRRLLAPLAARHPGLQPSSRWIASRLAAAADLPDVGTRVQYVDLETFLADNVLAYTDRTSMAASLEVRVPYLDPRLVTWSFTRPFSEKLRGRTGKWILRSAFADLVPPENLAAAKRGFCPPLAAWMMGPLDRYFEQFLRRDQVERQGVLDWSELQRLRALHRSRRRDASMDLFAVIMFDVWWRRYIGSPS